AARRSGGPSPGRCRSRARAAVLAGRRAGREAGVTPAGPGPSASRAPRLPGASGEDLRCAGAGDDSYRGCLEVDMGVTTRGVRGVARVLTGSTYALLGADAFRTPGGRVNTAGPLLGSMRRVGPLPEE